jgi:hypothetical protein
LRECLSGEAEELYDEMRRSNEDTTAEVAYLSKMIAVHSQQTARSALLDISGCTPEYMPLSLALVRCLKELLLK